MCGKEKENLKGFLQGTFYRGRAVWWRERREQGNKQHKNMLRGKKMKQLVNMKNDKGYAET